MAWQNESWPRHPWNIHEPIHFLWGRISLFSAVQVSWITVKLPEKPKKVLWVNDARVLRTFPILLQEWPVNKFNNYNSLNCTTVYIVNLAQSYFLTVSHNITLKFAKYKVPESFIEFMKSLYQMLKAWNKKYVKNLLISCGFFLVYLAENHSDPETDNRSILKDCEAFWVRVMIGIYKSSHTIDSKRLYFMSTCWYSSKETE